MQEPTACQADHMVAVHQMCDPGEAKPLEMKEKLQAQRKTGPLENSEARRNQLRRWEERGVYV